MNLSRFLLDTDTISGKNLKKADKKKKRRRINWYSLEIGCDMCMKIHPVVKSIQVILM